MLSIAKTGIIAIAMLIHTCQFVLLNMNKHRMSDVDMGLNVEFLIDTNSRGPIWFMNIEMRL